MSKRENETNKISDLIPQMLEENKLQKGMDQIYIKEAWKETMGQGVVNYTESVGIRNQIVYVKLNSSALREELEYGKDKIVKMLNSVLKGITVKSVKLI